MKEYRVRIVAEAERDIIDIHDYVASRESTRRADNVLREIEKACVRLAELPLRGHTCPQSSNGSG